MITCQIISITWFGLIIYLFGLTNSTILYTKVSPRHNVHNDHLPNNIYHVVLIMLLYEMQLKYLTCMYDNETDGETGVRILRYFD